MSNRLLQLERAEEFTSFRSREQLREMRKFLLK